MTTDSNSRAAAGTEPSGKLRVAVFGGGAMAEQHLRALSRTRIEAEVVAIADPRPEARDRVARLCPGAARYDSVERLLGAEGIDVVHVCTPPATHEELATLALDHGCHVYVEKPVAETEEAARRLVERARERGLEVCPGHQLLFQRAFREASGQLEAIGRTVHVESFFSFRPVRSRGPDGTPFPEDAQLLDVLPHPVCALLGVLELAGAEGPRSIAALEVGPGPTVHILVRQGQVSGIAVVSLEGRPVESFLRVVGTRGCLQVDFIRDALYRQIGTGASAPEKMLAPYRLAGQLVRRASAGLARRVLTRTRSYPGLAELLQTFYDAVCKGGPTPVSAENLIGTSWLYEEVGLALQAPELATATNREDAKQDETAEPLVTVTGGTGFLGRRTVEALAGRRLRVRSVSRRLPPVWNRVNGVDYVCADLANDASLSAFEGASVVIHCAAETSGGWDAHQHNTVQAAANVMQAAAQAGASTVVHVSSLAVLASDTGPIHENTPRVSTRDRGAYVWGKSEAERTVVRLAEELGLNLHIVRPAAIIDERSFHPPGRLGRRIGKLFIAMGPSGDPLPVVEIGFAAATLAWIAQNPASAPPVLNLLDPRIPTKKELMARTRQTRPGIRVCWFPHPALRLISPFGAALQRLRGSRSPVVLHRVFPRETYDSSTIAAYAELVSDRAPSDRDEIAAQSQVVPGRPTGILSTNPAGGC